jgi:hypothetical protein
MAKRGKQPSEPEQDRKTVSRHIPEGPEDDDLVEFRLTMHKSEAFLEISCMGRPVKNLGFALRPGGLEGLIIWLEQTNRTFRLMRFMEGLEDTERTARRAGEEEKCNG